MNDIQEVREMLASTNPVPPGSLAGSAQDGVGRATRTRITSSSTPRRRRSWSVRLVAVGGLAVAIAAGTTVVQNMGGTDEQGRPRAPIPGIPAGPAANAQEVLNRAAIAARHRPFVAPRPDQWVFVETRYQRLAHQEKSGVWTPKSRPKTTVEPIWTRADGKMMAMLDGGKLTLSPTGGAMPPQDYATQSKLPRVPDALLAWARKNAGPTGDSATFQLLSAVLANNVLPPDLEAAIYRALAKAAPGVNLNKQAVDLQGRPALSIAVPVEGWLKDEVLLDPSTYAYRGHRSTVTKDHTIEDSTFKKGAIESQSVRLAAGIVDRPGQRPSTP
ncbi:CU044_5270 family protein [Actinomadura sp. 6N118]|uniref:CU044_5270 family protein n=1 Tax=Actinomadura sp. 6N118 TaxID=3375151 RepID=UPI0037A04D5A